MVVMLDCRGGGSILASEELLTVRGPGLESTGMHQSKRNGQRCEATLGDNRVAGRPNHVEKGETRRGGR